MIQCCRAYSKSCCVSTSMYPPGVSTWANRSPASIMSWNSRILYAFSKLRASRHGWPANCFAAAMVVLAQAGRAGGREFRHADVLAVRFALRESCDRRA